jgi:hypothetical protein
VQEIDRLLSGGTVAEPWGGFSGGAAAASSYNAFAEGAGASSASVEDDDPFAAAAGGGSAGGTPRFGEGGDWGTPRPQSPDAASSAGGGWDAPAGAGAGAAPAGAVGSGTVLHTFVGDYNQPEELSVFEGDKVRLLSWSRLGMLLTGGL